MSTQLFHGHCEVCIKGKVEDLRTDKRTGVKKEKKAAKTGLTQYMKAKPTKSGMTLFIG